MFAAKPIEGTKWEEILHYAREHGNYSAGKKYAKEVNLNPVYLTHKITKQIGRTITGGSGETPSKIVEDAKARAVGRREAYEGIQLSRKEKKLIKDIAEGKVDLETASRVIASKAFEKLLKFPDSASFTTFIQSELLKLKREELAEKNTWAMELINRMFAGALPPRICPKCGYELVKLPELKGEVIEDAESISPTGDSKNKKHI